MKYTFLCALGAALIFSSCSSDSDPSEQSTLSDSYLAGVSSEQTGQEEVSPRASVAGAGATTKPTAPTAKAKEKQFAPQAPQMPGLRVSRVNVPYKVVALTFDDGPHGTLTPKVLDILNKYQAKGTFFVQGVNASRYPNVLSRMANEGHEVASHTWSHINMPRNSRANCESQLQRTEDAIRNATGRAPKLMRPPYGAVNSGLCNWMYQRFGYKTILWDVDTNDWRKPGVPVVISRAVNGAKPGSIILVHDIHASTVNAVEGIVRGLQERGFRLVTVSTLIAMGERYAAAAGQTPNYSKSAAGSVTPAPAVPQSPSQPSVTTPAPSGASVQPAAPQSDTTPVNPDITPVKPEITPVKPDATPVVPTNPAPAQGQGSTGGNSGKSVWF